MAMAAELDICEHVHGKRERERERTREIGERRGASWRSR
jgi:hypothetical protein